MGFEPTQNPRILVNWPLVAVHTWSRQKLPRNVRHTSIVARCRDSRELQPCFTGGKVNKIIVDNKRGFFANGVEVQRRFREVVVAGPLANCCCVQHYASVLTNSVEVLCLGSEESVSRSEGFNYLTELQFAR